MGKLRKPEAPPGSPRHENGLVQGRRPATAKVVGGNSAKRQARSRETIDRLVKELWIDPAAWLAAPNDHFGGRAPQELIGTDEEQKVLNLVLAIDQGLF